MSYFSKTTAYSLCSFKAMDVRYSYQFVYHIRTKDIRHQSLNIPVQKCTICVERDTNVFGNIQLITSQPSLIESQVQKY